MLYPTSASVAIFLCATLAGVAADPDPLCPYPSDDLTYFPDTEDCSQYYMCYDGAKTSLSCPAGFYWNAVYGYCDYAENVDCNQNSDPTAETITAPTTPTTTPLSTLSTASTEATTSLTTTPATGYTIDPMCPYPSETLIFYPYPDDCNKYYECFEGIKYLMSCPDKLYWNTARNYCDWPGNVDCRAVTSTTATPETTPTEPTTSTTTESTTSSATTTESTTSSVTDTTSSTPTTEPTSTTTGSPTTPGSSTTDAPSLCTGVPDGTFLADPNDCTKYIECDLGYEIRGQCSSPLRWNQVILSCDFPDHVKC